MAEFKLTFEDGSDGYLAQTELDPKEVERRHYAFPDERKFPLTDASKVMSAIKFFNYVDPKNERHLAEAILKRMEELGISEVNVGPNNRFKKYYEAQDGYLKHFGVKGMHWGVWNDETRARRMGFKQRRAERAKKKNRSADDPFQVRTVTTKNGETMTLERNRGGALAKGLGKISPAIRKEQDRTYNYNMKVDGKNVGNLQMYQRKNNEMNVTWGSTKEKYRRKGYMSSAISEGEKIAKELGNTKITGELVGNSPGGSIHKLVVDNRRWTKTGENRTKAVMDAWGGLTYVEKKL